MAIMSIFKQFYDTHLGWIGVVIARFFFMINQFIRSNRPIRTVPKFNIAIFGDGFAAGFGDSVVCLNEAGLARRLPWGVYKHPNVRHKWSVLNMGWLDATSADWLIRLKTVDHPKLYIANVVVISVGYCDYDAGISVSDTVKNIMEIINIFQEKKQSVVLCTLRMPEDITCSQYHAHYQCNDLLKKAVDELNCNIETGHEQVVMGSNLAGVQFNRSELFYKDSKHFNSEGYDKWSSNLMSLIAPLLTHIEYVSLRSMVGKKYA